MLSLRNYTKLVSLSVLVLIYYGALVKSHEAGLAVPDWPTSFGDNMFLFHPSKWIGIIYYEHVHRLIASAIGALTLVLALWLWIADSRRSVKVLGFVALGAVIVQGVLGGLTVIYLLPAAISVSHGVLAQTFFCITLILAYSQSKEWQDRSQVVSTESDRTIFRYGIYAVIAVYLQLILGAIMRHLEAGLALLDFPTMGGAYLPTINAALISKANQAREALHLMPVTDEQILVHILHRFGAVAVLLVSCLLFVRAYQLRHQLSAPLKRGVLLYAAVLLIQIGLGIVTVLSMKQPLLTSLHVVVGAALLGSGVMVCARSYYKTAKSYEDATQKGTYTRPATI